MGCLSTVWDGEIAGLERGLAVSGERERVLLQADSKATIQAVKPACRIGVTRMQALGALGSELVRR